MPVIQEFDAIKEKFTTYLRNILQLEQDLDKSKKEIANLSKDLGDAKNEVESLTKQKTELITEKEDLLENIRHFKELGEKDKREMDKLGKINDELNKKIKEFEKEIKGLVKEIDVLKNNEDQENRS